MIPLKDENPTRVLPVVTIALIGVNMCTYLYQLGLGPAAERIFFYRFGAIPYELTNFRPLSPLTALSPVPRFLTPITAMFIHGGFFHLAGNMLYLWIFGNNVEDVLGRLRFFLFYLGCGLAAALAHVLVNPNSTIPMIGASGAISGVLGAYFLLYPSARVTTLVFVFIFIRLVQIPAALVLGIWLLLQILSAASSEPGVAWYAHIGGFLAGMIYITFLFSRGPRRTAY